MRIPDAPEPLDATPGGVLPVAAATGRRDSLSRDLGAIPAFLRDRPGARAPSASRRVATRVAGPPVPDPAALPMAGIAPRRLVVIGATIVLAWMVISFGRQVADASAASSRADELRAANTALAVEVAATEGELQTIQQQRFIEQAARAYRLGNAGEVPFALQADAPPLAADAPGSASVRLGADLAPRSPLETWLEILFGPGD